MSVIMYSPFLFPAHAGVILPININQVVQTSFPRPRGGDPRGA